MRLLLVLFILCPLLELWLLVKVGAAIGALPVVALVILSAVLGIAVLRNAGGQTISLAQLRLRQRVSPMPALVDGFLLTLAGILLVLPGLLSDAAAVLLLIGPIRRLVSSRWGRPAMAGAYRADMEPEPGSARVDGPGHGRPDQPVVIDGEYRRES